MTPSQLSPPPTGDEILSAVSEIYGVTEYEILGAYKRDASNKARTLAIYTFRAMGRSWHECADLVGRSHHSTAMSGHDSYDHRHSTPEKDNHASLIAHHILGLRIPKMDDLNVELIDMTRWCVTKAPPVIRKKARAVKRAVTAGARLVKEPTYE